MEMSKAKEKRRSGAGSLPRISLLMLTWRRRNNLRKILWTQSCYDIVDEIIVFNNYRLSTILPLNEKTKVINASHDFGLRSRWAMGILARNRCLVFQDDDILVPEIGFQSLWERWREDPERLYAAYGRNPNSRNEYNFENAIGEVAMVLTRVVCVDQSVLANMLRVEVDFYSNEEMARPVLNGEDILLSYAVTSLYQKRHSVVPLEHEELPPGPHALAIRRKKFHLQERTALMRRCQRHFDL